MPGADDGGQVRVDLGAYRPTVGTPGASWQLRSVRSDSARIWGSAPHFSTVYQMRSGAIPRGRLPQPPRPRGGGFPDRAPTRDRRSAKPLRWRTRLRVRPYVRAGAEQVKAGGMTAQGPALAASPGPPCVRPRSERILHRHRAVDSMGPSPRAARIPGPLRAGPPQTAHRPRLAFGAPGCLPRAGPRESEPFLVGAPRQWRRVLARVSGPRSPGRCQLEDAEHDP